MIKKSDVVCSIENAFSSVTLGNGIGLLEAQAIDDRCSKLEQARARLKDEQMDWRAIQHDTLRACHSSLSFFDADGMRFHLPAFILASLSGISDDPIFQLTHLNAYAKSRFTTLNAEQKKAIIVYLEWALEQPAYLYDYDIIKKALNTYWYNC